MKEVKVIPLVPSLNPDEKMTKYIKELIKIGFEKIIVINDGSSKKYDDYFNEIKKYKEVEVLKHAVNQGKGRALKTGFNHYLNNYNDYNGIVTADADGQHSPKDTLKVAKSLEKNKKSLILGTRNFNEKQVPFNSKWGNKITTFIFKLFYGKQINDTQTGLRGIPNNFIPSSLKLEGERFDYEINVLIQAVKEKINIKEEIIETIYIDENKSSHYNPVKDSIKIYKILLGNFFKFAFSGIFSFVIDYCLFYILANHFLNFQSNFKTIFIATVVARIVSSLINYKLNKELVFKSSNINNTLLKYYSLCIIQMLTSALMVYLLTLIGFNKNIFKIIVDIILFFISYRIQKFIIFK